MTLKKAFTATALATSLCGFTGGASHAQDKWDYTGFIYLWGAGMSGDTTTGQSFGLTFGEITENLEFGFMAALNASKGPWAVFGDLIYLQVSDGQGSTVGPGFQTRADVRVKGLVFTTGVGMDVVDNGQTWVNGFGGLRRTELDTTANLSINTVSTRRTANLTNWDAVIGLRGSEQLSDRWLFSYYADVGTGESDLTWQAALTLDYQFDNWDLSFGYRYLTWDISNSPVLSDLTFDGPFIGAKFHF